MREAIPMSCRRALQLIKQKLSTAMPWYMRQAVRETIDREQCARPRLARRGKTRSSRGIGVCTIKSKPSLFLNVSH
ncbi:hypothetical protein M0802_000819 [Mischocyttarus mexicanus]|nr:hypothetical protein M0802_000819 [Mischocyttarus mexicanus]